MAAEVADRRAGVLTMGIEGLVAGSRRMLILTLLFQMLAMSLPLPRPAVAQNECLTADEPNDQSAEAIDLGMGEICADAANPAGGQDLYLWTVETEHSTSRWTISVSAIPGQLANIEIFDVVLDEAANVTSANKLLTISGTANEATVARDLILAVGTVITIGVATSGPGDYTLSIERGTEVDDFGHSADGAIRSAHSAVSLP